MKKLILVLAAVLASASLSAPAGAQQYPDRAIKMIVPWAAGGDTDNIFRPLAPLLQKHLGQPVVIANVTGASGTVGAREAKGSPADGYTIYAMHDYIHLVHYSGLTDISYKDFEPICLVSATPSVLTASPKTPWKDWAEFLADAKKRPGEITVGATLSSTSHIFPATIEKAAGIKLKYVSYEGLAPRMNAILGGHVDLTDSNLTQKGKVDAGQLKFLAIATEQRDPELPNVPTLKELGYNIVYEVVRGLVVPKGTPAPVRAKLVEACGKATSEQAFKDAMKLQGTRVAYLDSKQVRGLPRQDRRREQDDHGRPRAPQEVRRHEARARRHRGADRPRDEPLPAAVQLRPAEAADRAHRSGLLSGDRAGVHGADERGAGAAGHRRAAAGRARRGARSRRPAQPKRNYGLVLASFVVGGRLHRAAAAARLSHRHRAVRRRLPAGAGAADDACASGRSSWPSPSAPRRSPISSSSDISRCSCRAAAGRAGDPCSTCSPTASSPSCNGNTCCRCSWARWSAWSAARCPA